MNLRVKESIESQSKRLFISYHAGGKGVRNEIKADKARTGLAKMKKNSVRFGKRILRTPSIKR